MSPIKGVTDRAGDFPSIGDVRKGSKKGKNVPGKDLDYFRVEFDELETEAIVKFADVYPEKPQELRILLPFDNIERCWDVWLEAYVAGAMIARADGEKYIYLRDQKTGEVLVKDGKGVESGKAWPYSDTDEVGSYTTEKGGKKKEVPIKCVPTGRLKVILPELVRLAYMTVHTTSFHDIVNISDQLTAIQKLAGTIVGIPMTLKRRPKMISTPSGKGGKRVRREKWMLSIEADPDWVKEKLQAMKLDALPGNGLALLPGGDVEDTVLPEAEVEGEAIVEGKVTEAPKVSQDDPVIKFTPRHYAMAVDDKKAPDMDAAADWLNRSVLPLGVADDVILKWLGHFNSGLDLHEGIEDKAAIYANNKYAKHNKGAY